MARQTINSILNPEMLDMIQQMKLDISRTMNCVKIAQVQSFDPSRKTVQAQIVFKRVLGNGTIADYPVLVDCPVFTLQGGGGAIQFPIQAGDHCILLFSDRNIDAWFANGGSSAPFDARAHDLSDGIALVGVNALSSDLAAYQANVAQIFYDGAMLSLSGGIVTIENNITTLLTLLNGLITVIAAITVQDGASTLPLTTAAIAALNAYKITLAELLG